MFCANETLNNNYILNYRKKYLGAAINQTTEDIMLTNPMNDT